MDNVENLMSYFPDIKYVFDKEMPKKQKGLYVDNVIYLNPAQSNSELFSTLSEEIGHHCTSIGDITDQKALETTKQERLARQVGSEISVHPSKLLECKLQGFRTDWECAEYLGVTLDHFRQALRLYKDKYGLQFEYDGYIFIFGEADALDIKRIIYY